jgi:hypothetical protein
MMDDTLLLDLLRDSDPAVRQLDLPQRSLAEPWNSVFDKPQGDWKIAALDLWAHWAPLFPQFVAAQRNRLQQIFPVHFHGEDQVAYLYEGARVFCGGIPGKAIGDIPWNESIPLLLARFYQEMHDGYGYAFSRSLGPLPLREQFWLHEILEDTDALDKRNIPWKSLVALMGNGGGAYLCLDASRLRSENAQAWIWWKDDVPDTGDLCVILDTWMAIGLDS